jgi:hypothetical protein
MNIPNAYYLIVDLEATCSDDGSVLRHEMEIIEIGAVLQNAKTFEIESQFQTFVRPVRHPRLTAFCTELTGIRQDMVAAAPLFPEALESLPVSLRAHECESRVFPLTEFGEKAQHCPGFASSGFGFRRLAPSRPGRCPEHCPDSAAGVWAPIVSVTLGLGVMSFRTGLCIWLLITIGGLLCVFALAYGAIYLLYDRTLKPRRMVAGLIVGVIFLALASALGREKVLGTFLNYIYWAAAAEVGRNANRENLLPMVQLIIAVGDGNAGLLITANSNTMLFVLDLP